MLSFYLLYIIAIAVPSYCNNLFVIHKSDSAALDFLSERANRFAAVKYGGTTGVSLATIIGEFRVFQSKVAEPTILIQSDAVVRYGDFKLQCLSIDNDDGFVNNDILLRRLQEVASEKPISIVYATPQNYYHMKWHMRLLNPGSTTIHLSTNKWIDRLWPLPEGQEENIASALSLLRSYLLNGWAKDNPYLAPKFLMNAEDGLVYVDLQKKFEEYEFANDDEYSGNYPNLVNRVVEELASHYKSSGNADNLKG